MRRELCFGLLVAWVVSARLLDAQVINASSVSLPAFSGVLIAACETLLPEPYWEKLRFFGATFFFHPEADGGGDGGSGTGSGGDGGSGTGTGGDGGGGASDSGDASSGASDSSGSASDSTGPGDNGDPDPDPGTTDNGIGANEAPTDPITNVTALDFAAQQAYDAVANPFGGVPNTVFLQHGIANRASDRTLSAGNWGCSSAKGGRQRRLPFSPGQGYIHFALPQNEKGP
jgi:hypothetical protein